MPGAILNVFDFLDYFKFFLYFPRLLVSFASLAELQVQFLTTRKANIFIY